MLVTEVDNLRARHERVQVDLEGDGVSWIARRRKMEERAPD